MTVERSLLMSLANPPVYVEDVFSTYLYTGTDSSLTITNGINLSGKGGMVWIKSRSGSDASEYNSVYDTIRTPASILVTNNTDAADTTHSSTQGLTAFNSNGFSLGTHYWSDNWAGQNNVAWTFRKQPKFFDVVTFTGNGTNTNVINHALGSVPGMIIIKSSSNASSWNVCARASNDTYTGAFNLESNAQAYVFNVTKSSVATSTTFDAGYFRQYFDGSANTNGYTYVAYLFAHDAGGFGASGTDSVIYCSSYIGNGDASGPTINLGWEPQWVLIKDTTGTHDWYIVDNMRGFAQTQSNFLYPNSNAAESVNGGLIYPTATGFQVAATTAGINTNGNEYIYVAIRRGPMKTPTSGTSVFNATLSSAAAGTVITTGVNADLMMVVPNLNGNDSRYWTDRLRGFTNTYPSTNITLFSDKTDAEISVTALNDAVWNTSFQIADGGAPTIYYSFSRAPGFFDEVCYTGTGTAMTINHNLGVPPELIITKNRSNNYGWFSAFNFTATARDQVTLDSDGAGSNQLYTASAVYSSQPTSTTYYHSASSPYGTSTGNNYVAYLFATCPGVSKVGTYTGTAAALNVNCGFAAGARFVLIKRTDSTGDWYVYDSTRGISSGNDPYFLINTNGTEVTNTDYVGAYAAGFSLTATAPAALNANGGTYIYLAIA